ncbi:MAG: serine hydrolase [Anaerolineae bacterium]|nr:serine hydrolase [Anaerolineae bacterium]
MSLQEQIIELIAQSSAQIGVAIRHLETGAEVMIDADRPVPLASVVKVPVLAEAFRQIREGRLRPEDRWTLTGRHKNVGSTILTFLDDGLPLTVQDLLVLMIIVSDNTATDMLMERLGLERIDGFMYQLGLPALRVRHTLREIFDDMLPTGDPNQDRAELARWEATVGVKRDGFAFSSGPDNNVGTPRVIARLMEMIYRAELLDPPACQAMLDIMLKQQINDRFPRYLPAGTRVAHKTGSFAGVRNDAGILYVSDDSHVAFALLSTWDHEAVRGNTKAAADAITALDKAFGEIGLTVYNAFATQRA